MKNHELKTWPTGFNAIAKGIKRFELREDDRGFEVGDLLTLREYDPKNGRYTRSLLVARVTYIARSHGEFKGLAEGYVVMGIKPVRTWYGAIVRHDY